MFGADMHDDNIPAYASKELDRRKDMDYLCLCFSLSPLWKVKVCRSNYVRCFL